MKKLTAILLMLFVAFSGFSQSGFRVQAGPAFSKLNSGNTSASYDNIRIGFTAGVGYEMAVNDRFVVEPEFNLLLSNATETISNADLHFSYLQIPVLLKVFTNHQRFGLYAGPQLAFRTKAVSKVGSNKTDIARSITETEFGAVAGVEYITSQNVFFNLRFQQGLTNVFKVEYGSPNTSRNQVISITLGYRFAGKK